MKKILSLLVLFPLMVMGQTQTENYIINTTYKDSTKTSIATPTITQASQNITYFDGLGRPIQQIAHQQSASGKDIVTPIEYDSIGRQPKEFLPYVPGTSASLDYKPTALVDVLNYSQYSGQNPFSKKQLEASPLNRVMKQAAPGTDWALGSGHEIKLEYQTNTTTDVVKLFAVTVTWDATKGLYDIPTSLSPTDYLEFQLYKNITYDENTAASPTESNGSTIEFKNKEGQVVLKRTYESGIKHDTYYVYDQYSNLTFVIPPLVDATTTISNTIINDLCYQYKYDYRNRMVEKKLPGKGWEFIVYDKLDRPALTQDANLRKTTNLWQFTKYDVFGRVAYTGIYPNVDPAKNARAAMQNYFDTQNSTSTKMYETRVPMAVGGGYSNISYTSNNFPKTSLTIYTVNYYDNYDFYTFNKDGITLPATTSSGDTIINYNNAAGTQLLTKGLLTGTKIRVLDSFTTTNYWITTATGYDAKSRPIYTVKSNKYLSTLDIAESKLDFVSKVDKAITRHSRGNTSIVIEDIFTYDQAGRLIKQTQAINGATPPEVIVANTYDELGQLVSKKVGGKTSQGLQTVDYAYNIRGWITGINNDPTNNLVLNTNEKDLFAFKINYNTTEGNVTSVKSLYNGNISETYYRTGSDNVLRKYGYEYDNLNRLKNAIYQKPGGNTYPTYEDYSEKNITYDKNGNIQTLYRNGDLADALPANQIDDLHYTYKPNSNILTSVYDNSGNTSGFKDGNLGGDDYTYDDNGNLTTDKNKEITNISYNYFNLPTEITFRNDSFNSIRYIYDALGTKEKKIVFRDGDRTETCYAGNFQYVQYFEGGLPSVLKFFSQPEGYVEPSGSSFKYVYQYKDHLGNIRLSYQDKNDNNIIDTGEILEENNYYPFGLKHNGYNDYAVTNYKYKYNGKELQDELGLNMYDYGARNYDPAIGRWMNLDPLAEKYRRWSPYNYCVDNPMYFTDPDGMGILPTFKTDTAKQQYVSVVNNGMGGMNEIKTDPLLGGRVQIVSTGIQGPMTESQQAFYDEYKAVVDSSTDISPIVYERSVDANVGNFVFGTLDMADVLAFDKAGPGGTSSAGALIHETKEQLMKAELGLKNGDTGKLDAQGRLLDFPIPHGEATKSGDKVDGNRRVDNNIYIEKDGSMTKQTIIPNETTGRNVVTKEKIK
jgi:RHS repeat-associated protein